MPVTLEYRGAIAIATLNRPEALNALSLELLSDLKDVLGQIRQSAARGLLITGSGGKAFCAGADIKEMMERSASASRKAIAEAQAIISSVGTLPIPSVAMINGFAFGGGLEIALACTFRIAMKQARMGLPEIKLGLIPGYGGTQRLPRLVGESRALDLILSGRTVDADEAYRMGLVDRLSESSDPIEAGVEFLAQFTGFSLAASVLAREAVARGAERGLDDALKIEGDLLTLALQSSDAKEGMLAFIEKRKASFKDE